MSGTTTTTTKIQDIKAREEKRLIKRNPKKEATEKTHQRP